MSLTVAGLAVLGVAARRKHDSYVHGCDVLAGQNPTPVAEIAAVTPGGMTYWSSVAAGLTVIAAWTLFSKIVKVK